eukprot:1523679-Rhodomonas_salina.1
MGTERCSGLGKSHENSTTDKVQRRGRGKMVGVQIDQLQQNHSDVPGNATAWRGKEGARREAVVRALEESRPRGYDGEAVPDKARDGTSRR